jgi:hypothetical protein
MEYSKMRRDGSARNSVDRRSVAAEPISARIFRNRAKSSTMKLPLNVTCLPQGQFQHADDREKDKRKRGDQARGADALKGTDHQQRHRAHRQDKLRQDGH